MSSLIDRLDISSELREGIKVGAYFDMSIKSYERAAPHNRSALNDVPELERQLGRQLLEGALELIPKEKIYSVECWHPLTLVYKSNGDGRLCIDLSRGTNERTRKVPFKYPAGPDVIRRIWREGVRSTAVLDLKDGFFNVRVHEDHKKHFAFRWKGKCYWYNRMPFGYSLAPFIFQSMVEKILGGEDAVNYMDDIFIWSRRSYARIIRRLSKLGFIINWKKSRGFRQKQIWVGYEFDLLNEGIKWSIPLEKLKKLDKMARERSSISIASWLNFYSRMIPVARKARVRWYGLAKRGKFSPSLLVKTRRIIGNSYLDELVGADSILIADASNLGWAVASSDLMRIGLWTEEEKRLPIAYREAMALRKGAELLGKTPILISDSSNVVAVLKNRTSTSPDLAKILKPLYSKKRVFPIKISSSNNSFMDYLSRLGSASGRSSSKGSSSIYIETPKKFRRKLIKLRAAVSMVFSNDEKFSENLEYKF